MGKILSVTCKNCHYHPKNVKLGGGMSDFKTYCGAPAINLEKNEVVTVNYFDSLPDHGEHMWDSPPYLKNIRKKKVRKKEKYKFFFEEGMFVTNGEEDEIHIWGDLKFQRANNLCPKCGTFNLEFNSEALFD